MVTSLFNIFKSNKVRANEFEKTHLVGFLKIPRDLDTYMPLAAPRDSFVAPKEVMLLDYCTHVEDQGSTPTCAAFSASMFAENILWRKTGRPQDVNPYPLYTYAKSIDGDKEGAGTTIPAVLKALTYKNIFDAEKCAVKLIRDWREIRFAIHKFGCCVLGFNISREWYACNPKKPSIYGQGDQTLVGGHAVLCCGYDRQGIYIYNSWGQAWGRDGYALISWNKTAEQFLYGGVLDNCLYDISM